ncbi:hypothetical protein C3U89_005109 [Escherichia coli]|nr:hypothetical protein [Escherichia coli]EFC3825065.1 hypothetical protein [Escherichia coli]EFC7484277.1 hypothetical protein [Escherichia coli]EFC8033157.1 hypothetical protein [Escherichia coli]EFC8383426.1 hypothetical protein [Escherichia coli]
MQRVVRNSRNPEFMNEVKDACFKKQAFCFEAPDGFLVLRSYSAAIFLIPICISFDTAEKRRYATYLILNRRFSFEF